MRHISAPNLDSQRLFSSLYERLETPPVELSRIAHAISEAEREYLAQCEAGNFNYQTRIEAPNGVDKDLMGYIYSQHLRDGSGRQSYIDILKGSDGRKLCSFCGLREAESADHYKEQSLFPLLAVFPGNLIPACVRCNGVLGVTDQRFHAYYDDVRALEWLEAKIIGSPGVVDPGVKFSISTTFSADASLVKRVECTFNKIGLAGRWGVELAPTLSMISRAFMRRPSQSSREDYISDLIETDPWAWNGPHQSLYRAILKSEWIKSTLSIQ